MILTKILSFIGMLIISAGVAYAYYKFYNYKYLGKIYGGIIFAFIGAIICNFILKSIVEFFSINLSFNILSVVIGAVIFTKILNKATPK